MKRFAGFVMLFLYFALPVWSVAWLMGRLFAR